MNLETSVGFDDDGVLDFKAKTLVIKVLNHHFRMVQDDNFEWKWYIDVSVIVVIDTENPSKLHKTLVP